MLLGRLPQAGIYKSAPIDLKLWQHFLRLLPAVIENQTQVEKSGTVFYLIGGRVAALHTKKTQPDTSELTLESCCFH